MSTQQLEITANTIIASVPTSILTRLLTSLSDIGKLVSFIILQGKFIFCNIDT